MPLTTFSYSYGNNRYDLSFDWDDKALMEGLIAVPITASLTSLDGSETYQSLSAKVGVELKTGMLVIEVNDERAFQLPLRELFHEDTAVGQAIEKVHASFIAVDPVTGCLIRAGLSTSV